MNQRELLDEVLKRLTGEIRRKEAEKARLESELKALWEKAEKLEQARAILVEETTASQAYVMRMNQEHVPKRSLQMEVLSCVFDAFKESGAGVTVSDVIAMLKARNHPGAEAKSFYPAIWITLKRLVEKGELDAVMHGTSRVFRPKDGTANLFEDEKDST